MIQSLKNYFNRHILAAAIEEREAVEAYDIWSDSYDAQPGNLMLDLDELLFSKLLAGVDLKNKNIADIGCGTGRHWPKLLKQDPASVSGFDVSRGMLDKLRLKFPATQTHVITDNHFLEIEDDSFNVIISTLTVAHIENIEEALEAWCRIARFRADIIITDFHPDALAFGGKRTFRHQNTKIAVRNFVHSVNDIKRILQKYDFVVASEEEMKVDESVMHYYKAQNALHVYKKFKGLPVIYGINFRRA